MDKSVEAALTVYAVCAVLPLHPKPVEVVVEPVTIRPVEVHLPTAVDEATTSNTPARVA